MESVKDIFGKFALVGELESCERIGDGHINDTFLVTVKAADTSEKYVLQRINKNVFQDTECLMNNIVSVSEYMLSEIALMGGDTKREALSVVKLNNGKSYYTDTEGYAWRLFNYVSDSRSYTIASSPSEIYKAASAFGNFQFMLQKFAVDKLCETVADFHNTPKRFSALVEAAQRNELLRLSEVMEDYEFVLEQKKFCNILEELKREGKIPLRVTHNDTKLNNVLFDKNTDNPICVVDLDTVMPGLSVNDFGDLVRSVASGADEDERDLSKVNFSMDIFESCLLGFLQGTRGALTEMEIEMLPVGAMMMTLECGIRFLTDYLSGDVYFKTNREKQNLDRARTHFKMFSDMKDKYEQMCKIVNKYSQKGDLYDKNLLFKN